MSRPQKVHKPIKGEFNDILSAIGLGTGKGKRAAMALGKAHVAKKKRVKPSKP